MCTVQNLQNSETLKLYLFFRWEFEQFPSRPVRGEGGAGGVAWGEPDGLPAAAALLAVRAEPGAAAARPRPRPRPLPRPRPRPRPRPPAGEAAQYVDHSEILVAAQPQVDTVQSSGR